MRWRQKMLRFAARVLIGETPGPSDRAFPFFGVAQPGVAFPKSG
jgi:hypothetical protein